MMTDLLGRRVGHVELVATAWQDLLAWDHHLQAVNPLMLCEFVNLLCWPVNNSNLVVVSLISSEKNSLLCFVVTVTGSFTYNTHSRQYIYICHFVTFLHIKVISQLWSWEFFSCQFFGSFAPHGGSAVGIFLFLFTCVGLEIEKENYKW